MSKILKSWTATKGVNLGSRPKGKGTHNADNDGSISTDHP